MIGPMTQKPWHDPNREFCDPFLIRCTPSSELHRLPVSGWHRAPSPRGPGCADWKPWRRLRSDMHHRALNTNPPLDRKPLHTNDGGSEHFLSICDSVFFGQRSTRINMYLMVRGPITIKGSTFRKNILNSLNGHIVFIDLVYLVIWLDLNGEC
jgi:hypothetical protein